MKLRSVLTLFLLTLSLFALSACATMHSKKANSAINSAISVEMLYDVIKEIK